MTQLSDYYRDRAAEYDAVYAKPERQDDLATLRGLLTRLAGGRILEIAAGTGYWTQVLSASAAAITATDINPETLDVARTRRYGPAPVTFQVADAYALEEVPGRFDMAFIGFFWSHILRGDLPRFLDGLRARLGPGAVVMVLDRRVTRSRQDAQRRPRYEIVKNFPRTSSPRTSPPSARMWNGPGCATSGWPPSGCAKGPSRINPLLYSWPSPLWYARYGSAVRDHRCARLDRLS